MSYEEFPYGGTTKSEDAKIERCVNEVIKTGKDKVTAIKICKASIMENDNFDFEPIDKEDFSKTLKGVEIFREGVYRGKKFTKKIIQEIVDNFKKLKQNGFEPPIRIGHRIDGRSDINARNLIGYVDNVYSEEDKNGISHLYADSEITDDDEAKKIGTTLRSRSVELGDYEDNSGNKYKNVLWGYGFVDIPQVENMKPIFSAEVEMFDKPFDKELYSIEMDVDKKDVKSISKATDELKKIMDSAIGKEDYWRVQRCAEMISNLKSMQPMEVEMDNEKELKEELAKSDDKMKSCVAGKMKDGTMKIGEAIKECKTMMDAEIVTEEYIDEKIEGLNKLTRKAINDLSDSDFAYIETGGKKDDGGKTVPRSLRHFPIHDAAHVRNALARIAQEAEFGKEALPKVEEAAKKFGINVKQEKDDVTLSKDEHLELMEAKRKVEEMEKTEMEKELLEREEKVKNFQSEGKIITENLEKEIEFAKSLTKEQFETYQTIKESQPKFIELDAEKGKQNSENPEDKKDDPVKMANENIRMKMREEGHSEEEIEQHLKQFSKE